MIENIKMPPTNFHHGGGLKSSSEGVRNEIKSSQADYLAQSSKKRFEKKDLKNIVDELNKISDSLNTEVKFKFNDKINEVYITVIDKKNGKVISKLPSEEAMKIKESMKELVGSLFDKRI